MWVSDCSTEGPQEDPGPVCQQISLCVKQTPMVATIQPLSTDQVLSRLWAALRTEGPNVCLPGVCASVLQFFWAVYVAEDERSLILAVTQEAGESLLLLDLG